MEKRDNPMNLIIESENFECDDKREYSEEFNDENNE